MTTAEMKKWIVDATYEELLQKWRFAPAGSLWFQGDVGKYFDTIMRLRKEKIGPEEAVRASKIVGWE